MGTGNYSSRDGETVILDLYDGIHEQAEDDEDLERILCAEAFVDFRAEMKGLLGSTTFWMEGDTWRDRDELVLARNNIYEIWTHEDSYGHVFLTYGLREDLPGEMEGMARANLPRFANRLFDRLQELYPLHVATSAWTSAPRSRSDVAIAA